MRAPAYEFPDDAALRGKRVLVLGLGLYHGGAAVCRFLHSRGCSITITDLRDSGALAESLSEIRDVPCRLVLGGHDERDLDRADFVVVNPAVPADSPFLLAAVARGIPLLSEVGLFFSRLTTRFVLITGSKGKTTTTALLHSMVLRHDPLAIVGGNIGTPLLDRVDSIARDSRDSTVVFEISSFQLEQLRGLSRRPAVTVVTNVFPVHIDRHGTFDDYKAAKREALEGAAAAVLNAGDNECRSLATGFTGVIDSFAVTPQPTPAYVLDGGRLVAKDGTTLLTRAELRIPGVHNVANALAAFAAADRLGVPREASIAAAREFRGVPHRLELVCEREGVRYVNDSIATTPQSVIAALEAMGENAAPSDQAAETAGGILLIAGGKETPFELDPLVEAIAAHSRSLFGIGETGARLVKLVKERSPRFPASYAATLATALTLARSAARSGDVILLSPAYPSFDQFRNFKERGEIFRRLAMEPG